MPVLTSLVSVLASAHFNLSNTLGDGMVLQREPQVAVVWGFGEVSATVSTNFGGKQLNAIVGADGIWRIELPPQPATKIPTTLNFTGSDGWTLQLRDVLFGDVYLCGGQSNMQYTPRSMAGMNNMSAEIAAADGYAATVRFFTVGMDTSCGDPAKGQTDCSQPFSQLNTKIPFEPAHTCRGGASCREGWEPASAAALGGSAWNTFSAICWLTGRDVHDALGGAVPIGLISSNWGGTPVQAWQPLESAKECTPAATVGGALYNSMIAPFAVGPMALRGATWYQGESNVGAASFYACAFPSMIRWWREKFANPALWFGFVQIAGYAYSHPFGNPPRPETDHSRAAGDLRQAQLAALQLPNVGMTTAVDTGDWHNIHPPDKQAPARRLAEQLLHQVYGMPIPGADFPLYAGAAVVPGTPYGTVAVAVALRAGVGGGPVELTSTAPLAATQSSTLGKPGSIPRTACVTAGIAATFPQDCGYPTIEGTLANGTARSLNATAAIGTGSAEARSSLLLTATGAPAGFTPTATSYGRASWPLTTFFSAREGGAGLPVIPWYSALNVTNPWQPPGYAPIAHPSALQRRVSDTITAAARTRHKEVGHGGNAAVAAAAAASSAVAVEQGGPDWING